MEVSVVSATAAIACALSENAYEFRREMLAVTGLLRSHKVDRVSGRKSLTQTRKRRCPTDIHFHRFYRAGVFRDHADNHRFTRHF